LVNFGSFDRNAVDIQKSSSSKEILELGEAAPAARTGRMPPKKSPAAKATAAKNPAPKKATAAKKAPVKKAAKKAPAKKQADSQKKTTAAEPTEVFLLNFDSEDEEDLMEDDVGGAFRTALEDRCQSGEVSCGYQKAKAVFELVVGKEGGSVMIDAGVRSDKRDRIIVGSKGKPITPEDFAQVSESSQMTDMSVIDCYE
jgi:hypothetical protein